MEKTQKLKKLNKDSFEVTDTRTLVVDKKELMLEIEEIKGRIEEKKRLNGITALERKLEEKESLLAEANKLK